MVAFVLCSLALLMNGAVYETGVLGKAPAGMQLHDYSCQWTLGTRAYRLCKLFRSL